MVQAGPFNAEYMNNTFTLGTTRIMYINLSFQP